MTWQIGPLTLHAYGFVLGVAVLVGLRIALWVGRRHEMDSEKLERLWWLALVGGLVGARLYHVIHYLQFYSQDWARVVYLWDGGLGIFGGLAGGVVTLMAMIKIKDWLTYLDLGALALPLAQTIGRVGNLLNQELYGRPVAPPWGWYIKLANRMTGFEQYTHFLPLWMFEAAACALLGVGLITLERTKKVAVGSGVYLALYLIGYGLIRVLLEPLRIEPWSVGGVLVGQASAGVLLLIGLVLLRMRLKYA